MIVVDASVLIAHLDARDAPHARALDVLLDVAARALAASPITIAEVLVGPARAGRLDAARAALRDLDLREIPLETEAAARLASLRADTSLPLPACCVLLAAHDARAESILTFDRRLLACARDLVLASPASD